MGGRRKSSGRCSRRMTATRSYTSFGFSKTSSLSVHNQLLPMPRSAEQISRRADKERERRAAESPASRQARLALAKAATRRRRQAQTLESSITAKRRNSEKKRERRAAESPASRQARLALDKAATRRRRQALESSITAKRLRASHHPLRETHFHLKCALDRAEAQVAEHGMERSMSLVDAWSLERVKRRCRPA